MQSHYLLPKSILCALILFFLSVNLQAQRLSDHLEVLYLFGESQGEFLVDHSQTGLPQLLKIENAEQVAWIPSGGLTVGEPARISSLNPATQMSTAIELSGEITMEAWLSAGNLSQTGPARIMTCSSSSSSRNFMLGQDGNQFTARVRTDVSGNNGTPNFNSPSNSVQTELQHVVYTLDNAGNERFYLDGELVREGLRPGNIGNFDHTYHFAIANEFNADRSWEGDLFLAAVYSSALSAEEVMQNFTAGTASGGEISAQACPEDCWIDGFGSNNRVLWIPNLPNNINLEFLFDENGGTMDTFDDGTAHVFGNMINVMDPSIGFFIDVWFKERMNWEEWSGLGRSWKGSAGIVGDNYLDWDYYIVDDNQENVLIGTGGLEGSLIHLTHKPANYQYGFQVGLAANDQNANYGMSCWFFCEGQVLGEDFSGMCDINMEGECNNPPVLACAVDVQIDCTESIDPENTGSPTLFCPEEYTLSYTDQWTESDCPAELIRTWTAINSEGIEVICEQTITLVDNEAPQIGIQLEPILDCSTAEEAFALVVTDNCDSDPQISLDNLEANWMSAEECGPGSYRTQTPGGWGAPPNGNNPGAYLHANFAQAFPNGLSIGCENTLHLNSAQAITDFLPSGSTPSALPSGEMTDPGNSYNNVLAGHLVALSLSLGFDQYDAGFGSGELGLGSLTMSGGTFEGWTIAQVIAEANQAIGGCGSEYSFSQLSDALASVNENFVDGTTAGTAVNCNPGFDCYLLLSANVTATDACGNSSTDSVSLILLDTTPPQLPNIETQITVSCDDIPEPIIILEDDCEWSSTSFEVEENFYSGGCNTSIERIYTIVDQCGNESQIIQYISVVDTESPVFLNVPEEITLSCSDLIPTELPSAADNCDEELNITFTDNPVGSGCNSQIIRTFIAEDNCGNTATVQQLINLIDNQGPVISGLDLTVELSCEEELPSSEAVVTDDCDPQPNVQFSEQIESVGCLETIYRTWVAIDQCGNSNSFSQVISISDLEAPVFLEFPADQNINCGEEPLLELPVVEDNCGSYELSWNDEVINSNDACAQIVRTFTAIDQCGNTNIQSQTFTILDNEAPVLSGLPQGGTLSCSELSVMPEVVAVDNCDLDVVVLVDETWNGDECTPQLLRTYSAQDQCGNTSSATVIFDLVDDEAPVFVDAPQSITVGCTDELPAPEVNVVDVCSAQVEIEFTEVQNGSGCAYTLVRTWTATDLCGNTAIHEQTISINDQTAPVFTFMPEDIEVSCGEAPVFEDPEVVDNCSVPTLNYEESSFEDECGVLIHRVWTAVDDCGNSAEYDQTIFIGDFEAPVLNGVPPSLQLDCTSPIPAPANPFAEDACSSVEIEFQETLIQGQCATNYTLVRTWTATDACGNSSMAFQTISVNDSQAPVFDFIPDDVVASCGDIPEPGTLTATDNCGGVTVSFEETATEGGCPNLLRTWTATDDCGNTAIAVQTVFIEDQEPPLLLGIPEDLTVSCNNIPDMPEPEASDNCDDDVAVTASINIIGTGCEYTIVRTWIAEDDCGNTTIESQSINVVDEAAPVFVSAPADVSVECSELEGLPLPEVLDDCGANVIISFEDVPSGASNCQFNITRTYTAADQCGNTAIAVQNIQVVDNSPPQFIGVPSNIFVECGNVPPPAAVQAVDACSGVVSLEFDEQLFGDGCDYYLQRVWTATDGCGNSGSIAHLVYVTDSQAPVVQGAPSITVDCNEAWPTVTEPTVSDNCTASPNMNLIEFTETNECSEVLTRIWMVSDDCGNTGSVTQTITRTDLTAPVISNVPGTITVNCSEIPDPAIVSASDNCSANVEISVSDQYQGGQCPYTVLRTWTAVDECGNTAIATQAILVIDEEAPVLSNLPEDFTVNCSEIPDFQFPAASDNCLSDIPVMVEEEWISQDDCTYLLVRTYVATDLCGNSSSHVQTITVIDNDAPTFPQLSEELFVQCDELPPFELILASDNCDPDVNVSMNETVVQGDCPTEQLRIRVWTAVDACGNTATFTQTVNVQDNNLPSLIGVPEDVTVSCAEIPAIPEVMGWDECQGDLPVTFTEEVIMATEPDGSCALGNAVSPAGSVAIWLPNLNGFASDYVFGNEQGSLTENPANGTAFVSGVVYNAANANQGWIIEIYLENARNWEQWSALGRSYKDDLGFGEAYHENWMYYEIDNNLSRLIGIGEFEGTVLSLSHAPSSYYYGVQIGIGANNRNAEYGMSGWFDVSGTLNGSVVAGMGDIMTTNNCCPDQVISRTWTVTDCAGNTVSYTQTITVSSGFEAPQLFAYNYSEEGEFDVTGTDDDEFMLAFRLPETAQARIDMFDLSGNLIRAIYEGEIIKNAEYRLPVTKSGLSSGMYIFRLVSPGIQLSDRDLKLLN